MDLSAIHKFLSQNPSTVDPLHTLRFGATEGLLRVISGYFRRPRIRAALNPKAGEFPIRVPRIIHFRHHGTNRLKPEVQKPAHSIGPHDRGTVGLSQGNHIDLVFSQTLDAAMRDHI